MKSKRNWVCFFSQTGTEIVNIIKDLDRVPDLIVTNDRPSHLREMNKDLIKIVMDHQNLIVLSNKPSTEEYERVLGRYKDPIVTLHGWLRIVPESICTKYNLFNLHPGLITKYSFLKGRDPQIKAFKQKLPTMGCVLHKVTAGVDEGPVIAQEEFNSFEISEEEMWKVFQDRALFLWSSFLKKIF